MPDPAGGLPVQRDASPSATGLPVQGDAGPSATGLPVQRDASPSATGLPGGQGNANPQGIGFWPLVREDFRTHGGDWLSQGFWALFWHRFGNWRMAVRPKPLRAPLTVLYRAMFKLCQWLGGVDLPYNVPVGRRVRLEHFGGMILVPRAIGSDVVLRQNTTLGIASVRDTAARPVIGDHVDIGAGAVILGDITLGRGAIVGANAVVTRSVPPYGVVAGVPARLLRLRDPAEIGDPPLSGSGLPESAQEA